jgi:hypothetical protein
LQQTKLLPPTPATRSGEFLEEIGEFCGFDAGRERAKTKLPRRVGTTGASNLLNCWHLRVTRAGKKKLRCKSIQLEDHVRGSSKIG